MNCKVEQTMTVCIQTAETYGEPPSDVDIEMAISKLKNRKATGHDQIPAQSIIKRGEKSSRRSFVNINLKNMGGRDHTI